MVAHHTIVVILAVLLGGGGYGWHSLAFAPPLRPLPYFYRFAPIATRPQRYAKFLFDSTVKNFDESSTTLNNATTSSEDEARAEAAEFQQRAQQLRTEARAMEMALESSKLARIAKKSADIQEWMDKLFANSRPRTSQAVARILMEERFTEEQTLVLLQALYRRRNAAAVTMSGGKDGSTLPTTTTRTVSRSSISNKSSNKRGVKGFSFRSAGSGTSNVAFTADVSNATNQTEVDLISVYIQLLVDAASILDNVQNSASRTSTTADTRRRWSGSLAAKMKSQLKEWQLSDQKSVQQQQQRNTLDATTLQSSLKSPRKNNMTMVKYLQQTLGLTTSTSAGDVGVNATAASASKEEPNERLGMLPLWVPSSLLPYVLTSNTSLNALDVRAIKERVLSKTRFYCTSSSAIANAAIFRGNMRPGPSAAVPLDWEEERKFSATIFTEIQQALELEGLSRKIQLFLLHDPERPPRIDSKEIRSQVVVLALPLDVSPDEDKLPRSAATTLTRVSSNILSIVATLIWSAGCYALNPNTFNEVVNRHSIAALAPCLQVFLGVMAVQVAHEVAHRVVAKQRGMKIGMPLLLPSFQLGTFGCITPLRSFPPSRSTLLDFALSGPLVSAAVSLLLMVIGCYKTVYATEATLMTFPTVTGGLLKSSFLTGSILTFLLPKVLMMPLSQPIPIHPLFMVGYSQLLISALNLLPIFRLDGGRACTAVVGPRLGALASVWTMLSVLSLALSGSRVAWTWGLLALFFQRRPEVALRDEVTPVNRVRTGVWVSSLVVAVLSLLPFPKGTGTI